MPEIILNTSGETRTTGTANPTITGDTGKSGSFADIADGTEIAYYRRYASNKPGFENGIGIWRAVSGAGSIGYIERTSVALSSNDNGPVVWGVGLQTIDATVTPGMIVADDDPRLEAVDAGDLDPALSVDGTELIAALKGSDGVSLPAQQVSGDPVRMAHGLNLNRKRGYSDFSRTTPLFSAANGAICEGEPYTAYKSGTGSTVAQLSGLLNIDAFAVGTGSTGTGYAVVEHTLAPFPFIATRYMETTFSGGLNGILPSLEPFTVQIGFRSPGVGLATYGFYFQADQFSPNWLAITKGTVEERFNTGVPLDIDFSKRFKIVRDPVLEEVRFYFNEILVHTNIPGRVVALSPLKMSASAHKISGSTPAGILLTGHSYNVETAPLVGF